jgi:RNA polymerase sigma factor (sigma-70 family)
MTEVMGPSDAQLVSGVLAGDRDAFAQVYDRYADRLHDFAYSMLRHREDAADAVADAFVTTAERLEQLRDPDRLRPWLYAVVRRECLRRLKARSRTAYDGDEQLLEMPDQAAAPETVAEQESLRSLVWDAAGGLNERDRAMLDLHLRQGLDGAELGEAMGMSASNAYVGLSRLRDQVERSIGALLVARTSQHDCSELEEVLGDWDGAFTPLTRKRVARHVDTCAACTRRRVALASPAALLAGVPAFAAPAVLRPRVLEDSRLVSALSSRSGHGGSGLGPSAGAGAGAGSGDRRGRRRSRVAVGTVAALLLSFVLVVLWQNEVANEPTVVAEDTTGLTSTSTIPATALPSADPVPSQDASQVASPTPSPSGEPTSEESVTPTDESTGDVSPTPTDEPSDQPTQVQTGTPTSTPAPGRLVASPRSLDLGTSGSRTLTVTNTGGQPVSFDVLAGDGWLSVAPATGTLKPGRSRSVTVSADRSALPEGTTQGAVTVGWEKGSVPIVVTASRETPPVIGQPTVLRTACGQNGRTVILAVTVTDEAAVASASVSWSGGGSQGSTTLSGSGDRWAGTIGAFSSGGPVQLQLVATDARGNQARRAASISVDPCPQ